MTDNNKLQRAAVEAFQRVGGYTKQEAQQLVSEMPGSLRTVLRDAAAFLSKQAFETRRADLVPAYAPTPPRLG